MTDLGYTNGANATFEARYANGELARLPALAADLVKRNPDVIFTFAAAAVVAAQATSTIPVVVGPTGERAMSALVPNFARPTGNVTGFTLTSTAQDEKCLQLLAEIAPRVRKVAVLINPENPGFGDYPAPLAAAARRLDLRLLRVEVRGEPGLSSALASMIDARVEGVLLPDESTIAGVPEIRRRIAVWATGRRVAFVSSNGFVAQAGALAVLGTDISAIGRRAAHYVHRILNGAKPSELPVERPTLFRLAVNLGTARALGLAIPQSVLVRADEIIEP